MNMPVGGAYIQSKCMSETQYITNRPKHVQFQNVQKGK